MAYADPGDTRIVSVKSDGSPGVASMAPGALSISTDGRYVAIVGAESLAPEDVNGNYDVYIRDRFARITRLMGIGPTGNLSRSDTLDPSLSADGSSVAFLTYDALDSTTDSNQVSDIYVRNQFLATMERVSFPPVVGAEFMNEGSIAPSISADGRFVAFVGRSTDSLGEPRMQVFVRDRVAHDTELISVDPTGLAANNSSYAPSISGDGRYVAFVSSSTNLVSGEVNAKVLDIFVRDRQTGVTQRVSVDSQGRPANKKSYEPAISGNGRFVAFASEASNLVPGDTNASPLSADIFVRDLQANVTERVNVTASGGQAAGLCRTPSISADGRFVAFQSADAHLVENDQNGQPDIFVRDRASYLTELVSVATLGTQGNDHSSDPVISGDGHIVAFTSRARNFILNAPSTGIYSHERALAPTATWTVSPSSLSFPNQATGTASASRRVTVTNTSAVSLLVRNISLGGSNPTQFVQAGTSCGGLLAARASCTIDVAFKPTATGSKSARLTVMAGAGSTKGVVLNGTGVVGTAAYTLTPTSIDFGDQRKGTASAAKAVVIRNTGTAALPVSSITLGGASPAQFSRATTCGTSLGAGKTCQISVIFKPLTTGAKSASLIVNAGGSPKSATLSGVGVK